MACPIWLLPIMEAPKFRCSSETGTGPFSPLSTTLPAAHLRAASNLLGGRGRFQWRRQSGSGRDELFQHCASLCRRLASVSMPAGRWATETFRPGGRVRGRLPARWPWLRGGRERQMASWTWWWRITSRTTCRFCSRRGRWDLPADLSEYRRRRQTLPLWPWATSTAMAFPTWQSPVIRSWGPCRCCWDPGTAHSENS